MVFEAIRVTIACNELDIKRKSVHKFWWYMAMIDT